MMTNKIINALGVFLAGAGISGAFAADGTLHVTGDVTTSTCTVDVAGTTTQFGTIFLGNVPKSKVSSSNRGMLANPIGKDFYISFANCLPSEQYKLTISGASQNGDGTFNSTGAGNAQLTIIQKPGDVDPFIVDARPLIIGWKSVGANSRSITMDVGLYRRYISGLTYGDLKYDVDYTVEFK